MCLKRVEKKKLLGRHNKDISLKGVSATFLLVCFVCLKESPCETRKMFLISLQ